MNRVNLVVGLIFAACSTVMAHPGHGHSGASVSHSLAHVLLIGAVAGMGFGAWVLIGRVFARRGARVKK